MRRYQAVLILKPDIDSVALDDFRAKYLKLLADGKAVDIETLDDRMHDLAHAIKKYPRAHFWRVRFEADPGLVAKLKGEIRHDETLLRQVYLHAVQEPSLAEFSEVEAEIQEEVESETPEAETTHESVQKKTKQRKKPEEDIESEETTQLETAEEEPEAENPDTAEQEEEK
ncbi:30S ribosomal protein S6 [candidate division WOR-3 bacterium]|nr:30S ribosomal protein S6 [candidate division WOR-3 bacterium]